jgi:photosystem II stability/assembly factor-like uncharacterized protein
MLRKKLIASIFVILILSVYAGCRRTEGILPQNNPQSEIPNQEVEIGNSKGGEFVPWETSHWEKIKDGSITAFAIDPKDTNIIYTAVYPEEIMDQFGLVRRTENASTIWKSEDRGKHWSILLSIKNEANTPETIDAICIDPECSKNIWISEHGAGVLFSSDGGITWKKDLQKSENDILKMYNDSFNNKDLPVVYMYRIPEVNSDIGALFSSLDSGKTWKRTTLPPLTGIVSNLSKPLAVDKKNPNIVYAFGNNGLFKAVEGRGNYEYYPVEDSVNTSYIYIDPQNPNLLYIVSYSYQTYNSFTTFKSSDCGKTWEKMGDFYFNPLYPDLLIKGVTTKETPPILFLKKLYVSLDNGKNWKLTDLDLNESNLYNISVGVKGIIYAETYKGLFKSEDKGLHWFQIPNFKENYWSAISAHSCFNSRILVDSNNPNIIYWASGLSKSTDGGKTWQEINIQHSKYVHGSTIVIDPHNHNIVYLGVTGINDVEPLSYEEFTTQGIYKSIDSGKTWEKIGLTGYSVSAIAVSPVTGIIYAGTYHDGLFMSKDSGKTWEKIPLDGDFHISVSSLATDSKNGIVYIGVFGGGIFKIEDKN